MRSIVATCIMCFACPRMFAQMTFGPALVTGYHFATDPHFFIGGGASAAWPEGYHKQIIASCLGTMAYKQEGVQVSGPRALATGDTTSAIHRYSDRSNSALLSFGVIAHLGDRHRTDGFFWTITTGIGVDRVRSLDDVTPVYSGAPYQTDETDLFPFIPIGGGIGYTLTIDNGELSCSIVDNWAFALREARATDRGTPLHHSTLLAIAYRWHP